jgi:ABC-2 type transport system permease protein
VKHVLSIARKELRGYFLSPVALIFLGAFLFLSMATVFVFKGFFARGVADVRPLFALLPVYLIFLSAAVTMRLWSEEQKMGTLEVLLTLPVRVRDLVLGKFLGALGLTALALLLTLSVPVTVSMLGDLDWGPVVGGYMAAILVAGAYLAIGVFVSSLTDNQIVSLMLTVVVCGALYIVGEDWITSQVGTRPAELLAALGTGARFESIQRGVLDLRDLVYYLGIIAAFLALNVYVLQAKGWSDGARTAAKRHEATLAVVLGLANVLLLNVWLSGVSGLRVDMTERGEYSISDTTKGLLRGLEEPVLIRGYFSEKTHPLLAPLVPRIRDLIEEYGEVAGGKVVTEYVDPREDEDLEKEANQLYGIKSFPFEFGSRLDREVVNSYFSILIKYGDQYEVLNFSDLIEVKVTGVTDIDVRLRNPEYDLTRAIKKVAYGFQTLEGLFAGMKSPAEFFAFITPGSLPDNYEDAPKVVEKVLAKMKAEANGKFEFRVIDPSQPGAEESKESLYKKYGFKPFATSLFSEETFYLHLLLKVGDRYERLLPPDGMSEANLEKDITAALKRAAPGFLKVVGYVKPKQETPQLPPHMQGQRPPEPPDMAQTIGRQLEESYTVEEVDLTTGAVPSDVDVLLVYGPQDLGDKERFALDQHLMRGGTVIVLASKYMLDPHGGQNLKVKKVSTGLEAQLASYGVELGDAMVMDAQNEGIPVPVMREVRGMRIREIQMLDYPYFVNVRPENMADSTPVVAGLPGLTLPWATPLTLATPPEGETAPRQYTVLLRSSAKAWSSDSTDVQPNFATYPGNGFPPPPAETRAQPLAAMVTGTFTSFFKGKKDPTVEGDAGGTVLEESPANARLVVVGSTGFANDLILQLTQQGQSNLQLVQNLVDWGVEDVDLLSIRSRGAFARTLIPMNADEAFEYELLNYGFVVLALAVIVVVTLKRRRDMKPVTLEAPAAAPRRPAQRATEVGS